MTERTPARWVRIPALAANPTVADSNNKVINGDGPFIWIGPEGAGNWWRTDLARPLEGEDPVGTTWTNELNETRHAPADLNRWWPNPGLWLCCLEAWALANGYAYPQPPLDTDGDGTPDEYDSSPNDPLVQ